MTDQRRRQRLGLRQWEAAKLSGLSQQIVSRLECGRLRTARGGSLQKYRATLDRFEGLADRGFKFHEPKL
jgi:predicted transcriptional regulator